jgi:branched-chain amino acid transport system substrate-binding protein
MRYIHAAFAGLLALAAPMMASAQGEAIKLVELLELSGPIASAGTNYKNGVDLAVKEINAAGGILGRKFETTTLDNQSNAGVAKALAQKAVDMGAFARRIAAAHPDRRMASGGVDRSWVPAEHEESRAK